MKKFDDILKWHFLAPFYVTLKLIFDTKIDDVMQFAF